MFIPKRNILKPHTEMFSLLLRVFDTMIIFSTGLFFFYLYHDQLFLYEQQSEIYLWWKDKNLLVYLITISCVTIISTLLFDEFGLYQTWSGMSIAKEIRNLSVVWLNIFMVLSCITLLSRTGSAFSKLWMACWIMSGWGALTSLRVAMRGLLHWFRRQGYNSRNIIIVGAGSLGKEICRRLKKAPSLGFHIVGYLDDNPSLYDQIVAGAPVIGSLEDPEELIHKYGIDQVWIALPFQAEQRMKEFLWKLRYSTVDISMIPNIFEFQLLNHNLTGIAGLPVVTLTSSPLAGINNFAKICLDKFLSSVILILVSPLMVLISILIKLDSSGPIFFKQKRHGLNGETIVIWKFRTMKIHKEQPGVVTQATKNDCRITRLGKLLRRTSLDELPQFINVLQGKMSIVGPRPHAIEHNEQYKEFINYYMLRHKVKPGITGLSQINGFRGEIDKIEKLEMRIKYDLVYINNWSFLLDLRIIYLTFIKGFFNKSA